MRGCEGGQTLGDLIWYLFQKITTQHITFSCSETLSLLMNNGMMKITFPVWVWFPQEGQMPVSQPWAHVLCFTVIASDPSFHAGTTFQVNVVEIGTEVSGSRKYWLSFTWTWKVSHLSKCWGQMAWSYFSVSVKHFYKSKRYDGTESGSECLVAQSCPTLCDPMDCSLPGSSVQGIFQARVLEWVAISFSRDLPDPGIEPGSSTL